MAAETVETPLTKLLGIKYPIISAGMGSVAGIALPAAVINAGGLGVIGGVYLSPRLLRLTIKKLKQNLNDPTAPFGIDLLLPKIGGGARKTNVDYTKGKLDELIDIIIESGAKLFVSAVGAPSKEVVNRLHAANILVMNMCGHTKHARKAINVGVDLLCSQGGEAGGHTGTIATTVLLPQIVDIAKKHKMPLYPEHNIYVVGAGGIYDGRGLAMALSYGAKAVWMGTRFVASNESSASHRFKEALINANDDDILRTLVYTGRPMRVIKNEYNMDWELNRKNEERELLGKGVVPYLNDVKKYAEKYGEKAGKIYQGKLYYENRWLSGQVAGCIKDIKPAGQIVYDVMNECIQCLRDMNKNIKLVSKL
eukprot:768660_1